MELSKANGSILIVRFHGFLKPDEVTRNSILLVQTIHQNKVRSILMDQRDLKVLSKEVQWFITQSAKELMQSGIKKVAVLLPENVFALAGITKINSELQVPDIEVRHILSETAGLTWLSE
jgi:hypothetical protein